MLNTIITWSVVQNTEIVSRKAKIQGVEVQGFFLKPVAGGRGTELVRVSKPGLEKSEARAQARLGPARRAWLGLA
jgi:hypothetical protein